MAQFRPRKSGINSADDYIEVREVCLSAEMSSPLIAPGNPSIPIDIDTPIETREKIRAYDVNARKTGIRVLLSVRFNAIFLFSLYVA